MSDQWTREKIMEVAAGFMTARILLSAAELDLFSKLAQGSRTVEELSRQEGWTVRGLSILLDALVATGFVRKSSDGKYDLAPPLGELLTTESDRSVLPMIWHMVRVWKSWSNLTEIVQTGENRHSVELRERPPGVPNSLRCSGLLLSCP